MTAETWGTAAIRYAAKGWSVVPLHCIVDGRCSCGRPPGDGSGEDKSPGKHPRTANGLTDASTDPEVIRGWIETWPVSNLALITGSVSGLVALDVDVRHGGLTSLEELAGDDPQKWGTDLIAQTGGGGLHLLFKHPDRLVRNRVALRPGLDIRGDGGYIVAAPSNHLSGGTYEWRAQGESGEIPEWLAPLLAEREFAPVLPDVIPEGQRDHTMTSIAGTMRARGVGHEAILSALRIENRDRCQPPLDDSDLRRIAASVGTYKPGPPEPPQRTDLGNGQRLVWRHGADLRYGAEWHKWLLWTGTHWQTDRDEEIFRLAKETALAIADEAKRTDDQDERNKIFKHAAATQASSKLKAMVELARSEREIAVQQTVFDTDPWKLNTLNGTIDLKTGDLGEARRSDLITKVCPVRYDPHARCPTWDSFLHQTFDDDAAMIAFIQRALGYSLTGDVREQKLFFLNGTGANGKSTLMETFGFMLGEYAQRAAFATFTQKANDGGPRNDLARMVGARTVITSEVDAGRRLDEALIKMLTGGDRVAARFLFQEIFEFHPQFKVFIFGNHRPQILGTDHAIWRRIDLIPFEVQIPDDKQDKELKTKLRDELPGILAWTVRGCLEWQQVGLCQPPKVVQATADYKESQDVLEQFLRECTEVGRGAETQASVLHSEFTSWCQTNNERPWAMKAFGQRMGERGTAKRVDRVGAFYVGIQLRDASSANGRPRF